MAETLYFYRSFDFVDLDCGGYGSPPPYPPRLVALPGSHDCHSEWPLLVQGPLVQFDEDPQLLSDLQTGQERLAPSAWKDDETVIQSVGTGELKCYQRARFFWEMARDSIYENNGCDMDDKEWEDNISELAVGFIEEGLWVWMEGDEGYMEVESSRRGDLVPQQAAGKIASELQRPRDSKCTRLLRSATSTIVRCGIMSWLAGESIVLKRLDERRGRTPRTRWEEPVSRWRMGMQFFKSSALNELAANSDQLGLYATFSANMEEAGHSCHRYYNNKDDLKSWLLIRTFISSFPNESQVACLNDLWDEENGLYEGDCLRCREAASVFTTTLPFQVDHDLRVPRVLVLLAVFVALHVNAGALHIADVEALQPDFPRPFQPSTLQRVEDLLRRIPRDSPDPIYHPWVNALPQQWRCRVQRRPPSFWHRLGDLLPVLPSYNISVFTAELNLRGWMDAAWLVLSGSGGGSPAKVLDAVDNPHVEEYALHCLKPVLRSTPTQAESKFQAAIQESYHTCWENADAAHYSRTMSVLYGTDNIPVVSFNPDNAADSDCLPCRVTAALKNSDLPPRSGNSFVQELYKFIDGPRHDVDTTSTQTPGPSPHKIPDSTTSSAVEDPVIPPARAPPGDAPDLMTPATTIISPYLQPGPTSHGPNGTSTFSSRLLVKRGKVLETIKIYLLSLLDAQGIQITENKLPWKTLPALLRPRNLEFVDWPAGQVPLPGSDGSNDKGLNGLSKTQLDALYGVVEGRTLDIRPVLENRRLIMTHEGSGVRKRRRGDEVEDGPPSLRPRYSTKL